MSLSYKDDLSAQNLLVEKKVVENDQMLNSLMSVLKKTAFRHSISAYVVDTIYLISIPLFLWALSLDTGALDDVKKSPVDLALMVLAILSIGFICIHSRVKETIGNDYKDSQSVDEYAKKIFVALLLKKVKAALKKSKVEFNEKSERLNVMMTMVYLFNQNSLIYKTDEEIDKNFNAFKNSNSTLSKERVLSFYLEQCIADFLNISFISNPQDETKSLKKMHKMYEKKRQDMLDFAEYIKLKKVRALEKKALKEKKKQLNALNKANIDIDVKNQEENEKILADGYVERRYFN